MTIVNAKSKSFLLAAMVVGLLNVPGLGADANSWQDETVLISPRGNQTLVRPVKGDKILFQNADPQLAIEWGLANARTTVVLAGKYVLSDRIDIPRDNVTLIIDRDAKISLNPKTEHTPITPGFRARSGELFPAPALIYNQCRNNVRVVCFGTLAGPGPVFFDGRNVRRNCGVEGGTVLVTGAIDQAVWLVDSRGVHVPLVTQKGHDAVVALEGCENCNLGMIVNLASEPGGKTGETVDLNSGNRNITIERLVGERGQEIIDMNASHADIKELVSIGKPQKLLCFVTGSGPRWTSRPSAANRLDVWKAAVLEDVADVRRRIETPNLPDALPRFTVKATVEVTLKDGSKKEYTKEVEIDVRSAK